MGSPAAHIPLVTRARCSRYISSVGCMCPPVVPGLQLLWRCWHVRLAPCGWEMLWRGFSASQSHLLGGAGKELFWRNIDWGKSIGKCQGRVSGVSKLNRDCYIWCPAGMGHLGRRSVKKTAPTSTFISAEISNTFLLLRHMPYNYSVGLLQCNPGLFKLPPLHWQTMTSETVSLCMCFLRVKTWFPIGFWLSQT